MCLMKKIICAVGCFIIIINVSGQQQEQKAEKRDLIQLSGRLTNDLLQPLPYAHVLVLNNYKGTITDKDGKYSFVVQENDTIMFSTVGYKRKIYIVPDTLKEPFYNLEVKLDVDTFTIGQVVIYPWKNYEEFKEAFLNLKLPDDDMERARKNIALIKTQIIMDETPNARENYQYILDQQYRETFNQGMYPTYNIFNAFAWVKFFEALKRGDFKKYSKTSD
jgi:hypothetical protein